MLSGFGQQRLFVRSTLVTKHFASEGLLCKALSAIAHSQATQPSNAMDTYTPQQTTTRFLTSHATHWLLRQTYDALWSAFTRYLRTRSRQLEGLTYPILEASPIHTGVKLAAVSHQSIPSPQRTSIRQGCNDDDDTNRTRKTRNSDHWNTLTNEQRYPAIQGSTVSSRAD
ncbi:hypothetical protein BD410DRAFT_326033 [Rickenella mellea]|uniref:Uncharacterized protein n=1 Tax=Rickenella mellea TaxID=50990 RepID=A0A4Y7QKD6_9AGAM|nr:hypothetical protein BD410DRAFT_326033 [Rickenella mellea]